MRNPPVFPPPSASRRSALAWGLFALLCGSLAFPNLVLLHVQPLASAYGAMGLRSGLAGAVLIPIGIWLCLLALFGRCRRAVFDAAQGGVSSGIDGDHGHIPSWKGAQHGQDRDIRRCEIDERNG